MTPEEEFSKWYEEQHEKKCGQPIVEQDFLECFLFGVRLGYQQGYTKGNSDGFREGTGWDE